MFGLEALDVLIALATVYIAFGVACTAAVEAVSAWFNVRSSNLEAALREFLAGDCKQNEPFVKAFYDHPLVQTLTKDKDGRPSYIPPEIVGQVVEAVVTANGTVTPLADAVQSLPDGTSEEPNRIKSLLEIFVTQGRGDAAAFCKAVEDHFDAAMDRASGSFKRYAQKWALIVSAVLVIGANADTVAIANSLATDPAALAKMVEVAQRRLTESTDTASATEGSINAGQGDTTVAQAKKQVAAAQAALDRAVSELESTGVQIGWRDVPKTFSEFLSKVAGLLVSILAVSLGAPFWFDVLQRFMRVRTTGAAPGERK